MAESVSINALDQSFECLRLESCDEEDYLIDAISNIPGSTRQEKLHYTTKLVESICDDIKKHGNDFQSIIKTKHVQKKLVPMISVLVGLKLKDRYSVINALKSENANVVKQTLRARWFFDGSSKDVINFEYFSLHVLPFISFKTLKFVISALAHNLSGREPEVAEHFFKEFVDFCGVTLALPLLEACNEGFILSAIFQYNIVLRHKLLSKIFKRYPKVIIQYLQLGNPNNPPDVSGFKIDLHNYVDFLPALITDYPETFVELVIAIKDLKIPKLGNKRTIMFMKVKHILMEEPKFFIDSLQLKEVCKRLTCEEYRIVFKKLFPDSLMDFNVDKMLDYLEYYKEDKINLFTEAYKDVYQEDFYKMKDRMTLRFVQELSADERQKIIRDILEEVPDWKIEDISGHTFLPVDEALEAFKYELSKHPLEFNKIDSIGRDLILCCHLNANNDALQEALEFIHGICKDTTFDVNVLFYVFKYFGVANLHPKHRDILVIIIDKLNEYVFPSLEPIEQILHYCIINDLRVIEDNVLCVFFKVAVKTKAKLNFFRKYPDLEYKCLKKIMHMVPQMFPASKLSSDHDDFTKLLFDAIFSFNERVTEAKIDLMQLSIKECPWLINEFEKMLNSPKLPSIVRQKMKRKLLIYDPAVYVTIFPEESAKLLNPTHALALLTSDHKIFEKRWKQYMKMLCNIFQENIKPEFGPAKRLIKALPWYGNVLELVKKSFDEFLEKCNNAAEDLDFGIYRVLGHLYDGDKYANMLTRLLPINFNGSTGNKEAETMHEMTSHALLAAKKCNPPVSLNQILNVSSHRHIFEAIACSDQICLRVSAEKIQDFASEIISRNIRWKMFGIRVLCLAPPSEEIYEFLANLCRTELDWATRRYLALQTRKLYIERPNENTLLLMMNCITNLKAGDMKIFYDFANLRNIPETRIVKYTITLLYQIDGLGEKHKQDVSRLIAEIFNSIDAQICLAGPERLWFHLCEKYVFRKDLGPVTAESARRFLVDVYLLQAGSKLNVRLTLLGGYFRSIAEDHEGAFWNKENPTRLFIHYFVEKVHGDKKYLEVTNRLFEAFAAAITPGQARWEFLMLFFCLEQMKAKRTNDFGQMLVKKEHFLNDLYPENSVNNVANVLLDFLQFFGKEKLNMTVSIAEEILNSESNFKTDLIARLFDVQDRMENAPQPSSFKEILCKKVHT